MRTIRDIVLVTALTMALAAPVHASFCVQYIRDTPEILTEQCVEVLSVGGGLYSAFALLETGDNARALAAFNELGSRLGNLSAQYQVLARAPPAAPTSMSRPNLDGSTLEQFQQILSPQSAASRALGLANGSSGFSMPADDAAVFAQAALVLDALANRLDDAGSLASTPVSIDHVRQFRSLAAAVAYSIDVLAIHSILLSTTGW